MFLGFYDVCFHVAFPKSYGPDNCNVRQHIPFLSGTEEKEVFLYKYCLFQYRPNTCLSPTTVVLTYFAEMASVTSQEKPSPGFHTNTSYLKVVHVYVRQKCLLEIRPQTYCS